MNADESHPTWRQETSQTDGQEQFMGEEQREGNTMITIQKSLQPWHSLFWLNIQSNNNKTFQNANQYLPSWSSFGVRLLQHLLAEAKPSQSSLHEPACSWLGLSKAPWQWWWWPLVSVTCVFVLSLMDCSNARYLLQILPSLRDSELEVQLLCDRGTATSRSFRYPGPGYTSRNLVNSFSPLLKWDSAAYLTEEHTIRHDLTSFLTLESRPKREKNPKPIFKSTLKILLNPKQFIFKPFIFSLNYVNLKI